MSSPFNPISAHFLYRFLQEVIQKWDDLSSEQRASGEYINPDEPVVMQVQNPEYDEDYNEDDEKYLHCHVMSVGGGGDVDEDGEECGHAGVQICGMEIDVRQFLFNGRRRST